MSDAHSPATTTVSIPVTSKYPSFDSTRSSQYARVTKPPSINTGITVANVAQASWSSMPSECALVTGGKV